MSNDIATKKTEIAQTIRQILIKLQQYTVAKTTKSTEFKLGTFKSLSICGETRFVRTDDMLSFSRIMAINTLYNQITSNCIKNNIAIISEENINKLENLIISGINSQNIISEAHHKNQFGGELGANNHSFFGGLINTKSQAITALEDSLGLVKRLKEICDLEKNQQQIIISSTT